MNLDVIGVTIVAVPIVNCHDLSVFFDQNVCEFLCSRFEIGIDEGIGKCILLPTRHAAVGVTQPLDALNVEHIGRSLQLFAPPIYERLARRQVARRLAEVAVGRYDQNNSVTLGAGARDGAARGQALVVGMSVKTNECRH